MSFFFFCWYQSSVVVRSRMFAIFRHFSLNFWTSKLLLSFFFFLLRFHVRLVLPDLIDRDWNIQQNSQLYIHDEFTCPENVFDSFKWQLIVVCEMVFIAATVCLIAPLCKYTVVHHNSENDSAYISQCLIVVGAC